MFYKITPFEKFELYFFCDNNNPVVMCNILKEVGA